MDYDLAKSNTLLYFFELLMRKGSPQKLQDMSCRFGDKGFTKEMRITVKSLAGLKRLLSEHPSLFTIDHELVYLNTFESASSSNRNVVSGVGNRDLVQDTKDFFRHNMLRYGIGIEIPILSLQGHRSQAPPHVRHISGTGAEGLAEFLSLHPDTFKVNDGKVSLLTHDDFDYVPIPERFLPAQPKANKEMVCVKEYHQLPNLCEDNLPNIVCQSATSTQRRRQYFIDYKWKAVIEEHTKVITTVAGSLSVTNGILNGISANDQAVVSLDCKGVHLGKNGGITLMAIGTRSGKAFLFDVLQCPQIVTHGGLKALLEDDRVIKVIHECCYVSANLHRVYQILLKNVFDTQSATAVLQCQNNGTQLNKTKAASFRSLIGLYYAPLNPLREKLLMNSQQLWKIRPLTSQMIIYAARNVLLLDEQLYGSMASQIKPESKPLMSMLCTEQILLFIYPDDVKRQKSERKSSYDSDELKQKIAQSESRLVLSNREIRHLRYLHLTADEKEKLRGSPKVDKQLDRLENKGKGSNSETDDSVDVIERDHTSLQTSTLFPSHTSQMDEFLWTESGVHFTNNNNFVSDFSTMGSEQAFSSIRRPCEDTKLKSSKSCCDCYADNNCQTLSTGDISYKKLYLP